eukprot:6203665-Pleurochrysis_carterae.AAC.2
MVISSRHLVRKYLYPLRGTELIWDGTNTSEFCYGCVSYPLFIPCACHPSSDIFHTKVAAEPS